jgi:hypothetical protein
MPNPKELNIDINQYVQWDEDGENVIYFNVTNFTNDAEEYLQEDNPEHKIKVERANG